MESAIVADMTQSRIWTIPPGTPFLRTLAQRVLSGGFPNADLPPPNAQSLPLYTILVPTRRAASALEDVFLDVSDGKALLLPRIRPLGDVDEEELTLAGEIGEDSSPESLDLPPAIPAMQRQILLAKMLLEWARAHPDAALAQAVLPGPSQAVAMAAGLAGLIDQLETENVSVGALASIAREEFAHYWQDILQVLDIIRIKLPHELETRGWIGAMERRNLLLDAEAQRLKDHPPQHPVIAAGTTGSIPATARLLKSIARLPAGAIVLPGLDIHLDEESWEKLDPQHPQFGLRQLLGEVGVARKDVAALEDQSPSQLADARARLFSEVMRPSATTDLWHHRLNEIAVSAPEAVRGLHHVKAANRREEALAIAVLMRKTLETPGRTAALITPDRTLGRQVCAELSRWSLSVDDSAGIPLARTAQGRLVHLMLGAVAGFDPSAFVALANHPLVRFGGKKGSFARAMNKLQISTLRGPVFARSLNDLEDQLDRRRNEVKARPGWFPHMRTWSDAEWTEAHWALEKLIALNAPFETVFQAGDHIRFETVIRLVLEQLENLCADETGDVSDLWQGEEGQSLSAFFSSLLEASDDALFMGGRDFGQVIMDLMMMPMVRPRYSSHPRLQILGLLEARMISTDVVILGGLNEDVWPRLPRSDPWLNRPMRGELGLQQPERRLGLAAHDFVQAACGGEVWITTSDRLEGAPAVPSRWMLRLHALLTACGIDGIEEEGNKLLAACARLDDGGALEPVSRPAPRPPVDARPRRLSITEVETWLRDPYSIFARHVLQLAPLEPLNVAPGPRELGILFHGILEEFFIRYQDRLPDDIELTLAHIADDHFARFASWPEIDAFWRPRFTNVARAIAESEPALRSVIQNTHAESYGRAMIGAPAGDFELTGRADRIDILQDGSARIFDYKTGRIPSNNEVLSGLAPQLLLEAALLARGGFKDIATVKQVVLTYLHITGGDPAIATRDIKPQKGQILDDIIEDVFASLSARVREFDNPQTPYPSRRIPRVIGQVFAYDHLARHREWANAETSGGET